MRRHLSLSLSLVLAVAGLAAAGIATTASAAPLTRPHATVKISSSKCVPTSSFCFKPATLTVAHGTKVTFKNMTFAPHTVTRCTTGACSGNDGGTGTDTTFGSPGTIAASGGKYSFVFKGPGTYVYYCQIHGYTLMHGTITVT